MSERLSNVSAPRGAGYEQDQSRQRKDHPEDRNGDGALDRESN
jgi:hypothetical protein